MIFKAYYLLTRVTTYTKLKTYAPILRVRLENIQST
jgi:hypothetical protein